MVSDKWLSRYGLLENFDTGIPHFEHVLDFDVKLHPWAWTLDSMSWKESRVGKKYLYSGIPRYFCSVVRTAAHLPVPRYSGVSIFSNRKPSISKILTDLKLKQLQLEFFQLETIEFNLKMVSLGVLGTR